MSAVDSAKVMFCDCQVLASLREPGQGGGIMTVIPHQWTVLRHVSEKYYVGVLVDVFGVLLVVVNTYIPPTSSAYQP